MPPTAETINTAVLDRMPLTARTVLEVGCGTGALGGEYKRRNPNCVYVGLEPDPTLAAVARQRLDLVYVGDVDADPTPFAAGLFDCIVYDDGLEHLRDPWQVLRAHVQRLTPEGVLVLCVPNIEHWSFFARLLRGDWDYAEAGLLDGRHLRWFTRRTAARALSEAGLQIFSCAPCIYDADGAQEFAQALAPALAGLRVEAADLLERTTPLQYVFVATRAPVQPLVVVSTLLAPVGGVSHVRVIEPLEAIATVPGIAAALSGPMPGADIPDLPRIFIYHRPAFVGPESLAPIREAIRMGYVVVCEFDDHPDFIPVLQTGDVQNFKAVHAVQTTTPELAAILGQENPEVAIFPNGVPRLPEPRNYAGPRMTLFFGGLNRSDDWPPYLEALNAVTGLLGERLQVRIVGDRGLFDALETPHKSFTPICDYETYQDLLATSEISLMPLRDNVFNRCKSDLKFIEAAARRVTALASPVAYAQSLVDGETGVLFRDAAELRDRLLRLVVNPDICRRICEAGRRYIAAERMSAYGVADRLAWYRDLWARKPELDRMLAARCPELFAAPPPPATSPAGSALPRFGFDPARL